MADTATSNGARALLQSTSHIPISQLSPLLAEPAAKSVKAIVTLTWPYSSATGSVAFLLAEPDFRLRRTRGQVRVQFSGSSAKTVAKSGISSGDEVILCLDGVAWVHDEAAFATPGRGLEFELRFTERLLLQFRPEDSPEVSLIDVNYPATEPESLEQVIMSNPDPEPAPPTIVGSNSFSTRPELVIKNGNEWSSPAFIKRARTSYGSLFHEDYDPFAAEDGTIRGKGRKRTRLSSTWRYDSRSPSPEVEGLEEESVRAISAEPAARPSLLMSDVGSQTIGLEVGGTTEVLADFSRQDTNASSNDLLVNGRELLEDRAQQLGDADTLDRHDIIIHTPLNTSIVESREHEVHESGAEQNIPSSPRLQPPPPYPFPVVSPLVTNRLGDFPGVAREHGIVEQPQSFRDQLAIPIEEYAAPAAEVEQEDHYAVGSARRVEKSNMGDLNGFSSIDTHGMEPSHMDNRFLSEDLYGHWHSATAQVDDSASPVKAGKEIAETQDRFYVEESEERQFHHDGLPISGAEERHVHQYPDLDKESHGHPVRSPWGPGPVDIPYPDLREPGGGFSSGLIVQNSLYHGPHTMSRSQSAQSAVVDLTESSDDEEVEEEALYEGSVDEKFYDDREGGSMSGGEEQTQQGVPRSRYFQPDDALMADELVSQGSRDEEFDEEFDANENCNKYHPGFNPEQEEDFSEEEEEGSYDEGDMEDDERPSRPPEQREPVVIDLLSSDDDDDDDDDDEEGDGEMPAPKPAIVQPESATALRQLPKSSVDGPFNDVQSQSDVDMDAEEDMEVPPNEHPRAPSAEDASDEPILVKDEEDNTINPEEEDDDMRDAPRDNGRDSEVGIEYQKDIGTTQLIAFSADAKSVGFSADDEVVSETLEPEQPIGYLRQDGLEEMEVEKSSEIPDTEGRNGSPENHEEPCHIDVVDGSSEEPKGYFHHDGPEQMEVEESSEIPDAQGRNGSPEKDEEPRHLDIDPGSLKQPSEKPSKQIQQLLVAQPFSLDGANDETPEVSYPVLPNDELTIPPATISGPEQTSQAMIDPDDQHMQHGHYQLPTPEATQLPQAKLTSDESLSSDTGLVLHFPPGASQNASNEIAVAPVLEYGTKEDEADAGEQSNVNIETEITEMAEAEKSSGELSKINLERDKVEANEDGKVAQAIIEVHNTRSYARQQDGQVDPVHGEPLEIPEDTIYVSPRRSHRRVKSTGSTADSQPARPITPLKSGPKAEQIEPRSVRNDRSSSIILDDPATPKGHDASIELTIEALHSPTNLQDGHRPPIADLKVRLSRALRTELSEFTALKVLRYHLTQKLDVLAVATTSPPEPQRAKGGPRHYQITFNITDPSIAPSSVTEVQVFRPYREALPIVKVGDGILLRHFQVISVKNRGFALRSEQTEASSWAVFRSDSDEAEVRGPPVEYGAGEKNHIIALQSWYKSLDSVAMAKISRANADKGGAGAGASAGKGP